MGQNPVIRSDGTPERDYLYLSDAVEGYLKAAEHLPEQSGAAFNVGTGRGISINVLVEQILAAVGTAGLKPRVRGEAPSALDRPFLASDQASRVLGESPSVRL